MRFAFRMGALAGFGIAAALALCFYAIIALSGCKTIWELSVMNDHAIRLHNCIVPSTDATLTKPKGVVVKTFADANQCAATFTVPPGWSCKEIMDDPTHQPYQLDLIIGGQHQKGFLPQVGCSGPTVKADDHSSPTAKKN